MASMDKSAVDDDDVDIQMRQENAKRFIAAPHRLMVKNANYNAASTCVRAGGLQLRMQSSIYVHNRNALSKCAIIPKYRKHAERRLTTYSPAAVSRMPFVQFNCLCASFNFRARTTTKHTRNILNDRTQSGMPVPALGAVRISLNRLTR